MPDTKNKAPFDIIQNRIKVQRRTGHTARSVRNRPEENGNRTVCTANDAGVADRILWIGI